MNKKIGNIKMSFKFFLFTMLIMFGMTSCVTKEYEKQESVFIVFKTPTFKHADLGFLYENPKEMKVEIYSNGQAVMALKIGKEKICMSLFECLDKKSFNKRVLDEAYPADILSHIFRGEAIFSRQNLVKTRNGFTQNLLKAGKYNINYSVLNKQIIFHDTINHIVIKVTRLDS
jgi:hypothetical protein